MKRFFYLLIAVFALLACVQTLRAQSATSEIEDLRQKIETIDRDLATLKLTQNRLIYEKYLEQVEQSRIAPAVFGLRTFHSKSLYDTVPHLGALEEAYQKAYKEWQKILQTDKQYQSVHGEYLRLRNSTDQDERKRNSERYAEMYARLRENNPDYEPANARKSEAMFERNLAITRFLLDHYQQKGMELPTHIIPDQQLRDIKNSLEVNSLLQEQNSLLLIRIRLNNRLMNLKYDSPKNDSEEWENTTSV